MWAGQKERGTASAHSTGLGRFSRFTFLNFLASPFIVEVRFIFLSLTRGKSLFTAKLEVWTPTLGQQDEESLGEFYNRQKCRRRDAVGQFICSLLSSPTSIGEKSTLHGLFTTALPRAWFLFNVKDFGDKWQLPTWTAKEKTWMTWACKMVSEISDLWTGESFFGHNAKIVFRL